MNIIFTRKVLLVVMPILLLAISSYVIGLSKATGVIVAKAHPPAHGPIAFSRYLIAGGMSYSYGFSIADYSGDGKDDIGFSDSWVFSRDMMRPEPLALTYIHSFRKENVLINGDDFDFPVTSRTHVVLLERQIPFDFDGDGDLDILAVANSHGSIVLFENPGHLKVASWKSVIVTDSIPGVVNMELVDVDADGDLDVLVTVRRQRDNMLLSGFGWLKNNAGSFEWVPAVLSEQDFEDPRTIQAGDVDNDGILEIFIGDSLKKRVYIYNYIDGRWVKKGENLFVDVTSHFALLEDVDQDGVLDFVFGKDDGLYLANFTKGLDSPLVTKISEHRLSTITEIVTADIDGDGVKDLVYSVIQGGIFWSKLYDEGWKTFWVTSQNSKFVGVKTLDYDGDGMIDIVGNAEYDDHSIILFYNKGLK